MATKYGLVFGGALNLREQPSTSATRLASFPNEITLAVTDHNDDWYATTYMNTRERSRPLKMVKNQG